MRRIRRRRYRCRGPAAVAGDRGRGCAVRSRIDRAIDRRFPPSRTSLPRPLTLSPSTLRKRDSTCKTTPCAFQPRRVTDGPIWLRDRNLRRGRSRRIRSMISSSFGRDARPYGLVLNGRPYGESSLRSRSYGLETSIDKVYCAKGLTIKTLRSWLRFLSTKHLTVVRADIRFRLLEAYPRRHHSISVDDRTRPWSRTRTPLVWAGRRVRTPGTPKP